MAINNLRADPERSILLALYALHTAHTREAEDALHLAVQGSRVRMALTGHAGGVRSVEFSPDGTTIATASFENEVTFWEAGSGQKLFNMPGRVARYSPDGKRVAVGAGGGMLKILDASTGKELLNFTGHISTVTSVDFSPDGKYLASVGPDGTARVWDAVTGEALRVYTSSSGPSSMWPSPRTEKR